MRSFEATPARNERILFAFSLAVLLVVVVVLAALWAAHALGLT